MEDRREQRIQGAKGGAPLIINWGPPHTACGGFPLGGGGAAQAEAVGEATERNRLGRHCCRAVVVVGRRGLWSSSHTRLPATSELLHTCRLRRTLSTIAS